MGIMPMTGSGETVSMRTVLLGIMIAVAATSAHAQINWNVGNQVASQQAQQNQNAAAQLDLIQRERALRVLRGVDLNNPDSVTSAIDGLRRLGFFDQAAQLEQMQRQRADAQQQQQGAEARADRARRVGALMAAGNCDGAKNLAVSEGDFDMAQRTVTLCTPKTSSPQP
jgi:hypothetical protein